MIRFGNPIIESVWNQNFIKNVQVTLAESLGVEDRAGYYDTAGALRDMIQNHALQIVSYLAMDEPNTFVDTEIRKEKVKALESMEIYDAEGVKQNFVRGQYGAGDGSPAIVTNQAFQRILTMIRTLPGRLFSTIHAGVKHLSTFALVKN